MIRRTRDERGSITIWLAVSSFVMMILVGLAVDLGGQVHAKQRAHNIAAEAARTGGEQVQAAPAIKGQYVAIEAVAARNAAEDYLAAAGVTGTVTVIGGDTITVAVTDTYTPTVPELHRHRQPDRHQPSLSTTGPQHRRERTMSQPTLRQRLRGLAATLVILLLVTGVPFLLIAIGAAPWKADLAALRTLLTSPDDGTLAMVVIAAVAWIAWAFVALSVVLEVVSQVRGLPTPTLPVLGAPQRAVGQLVAVAALLFVAGPTVVAAFPAPPARAAAAAPVLETPRLAPVEASPVLPEAAPLPAAEAPTKQRSTIDYTVKRGDSLWKIAERLLGDGTRFTEIVELNEDVLNGRPDFIVSGTVLKVPHEVTEPEPDRPAEEYVVQPGDTLSEIAEAKLGDPMRYPELFQASRNAVQPDGARLTDPDLIRPGWEITIPGQAKHQAEVPEEPPVEGESARGRRAPCRDSFRRADAGADRLRGATARAGRRRRRDGRRGRVVGSRLARARADRGWCRPGRTGLARRARPPQHPTSLPPARPDHRPSSRGTAGSREDSIRLRRSTDDSHR